MIQIVTWNDFGEGTVVEPTVEYGFRDLGIIQESRRAYLDADFPYHTNDLALPLRLYQLRQHAKTNASLSPQLDRAFDEIARGNLSEARRRLREAGQQGGGVEAGTGVEHTKE